MIDEIIKLGTIVGFKLDSKIVRGFIVNWNTEEKTYEVAITHINGVHVPKKDNLLGYDVGVWDGKLLGVVS